MHDGDADLAGLEFAEALGDGLQRPVDVGLHDDVERGRLAPLDPGEQILELGPAGQRVSLAAQTRQALPVLAGVGHPPGDLLVGSDREGIARDGDLRQAQDLDRRRRRGLIDGLAPIVEQGPDTTPGRTRDHGVTDAQGASLHQHGGHRTPPDVEIRLEHDPARSTLGRCPQILDLGHQQYLIKQVLEALAGQSRHLAVDRLPAPGLRNQTLLGHSGHGPLRIGVGAIDLVDRDHDGNVGGFGVVDGLDCLGHHAVVGGHDQHHDVGGARAPGPHGRERLVAGSVDEGERPVVALDLIGADVLGDPARLAVDHVRVADPVEQQRLAVVDVAHDGDHGSPEGSDA